MDPTEDTFTGDRRSSTPVTIRAGRDHDSSHRQYSSIGGQSRRAHIRSPITTIDGVGHASPEGHTRRGRPTFFPRPQQTSSSYNFPDITTERSHSSGRSRLPKFGAVGDYWKLSDDDAKEEDEELVKGMKMHLDNLLIFAGLFSAINSGFLALSIPSLSDDPASGTNNLIALLIRTIDNATSIPDDLVPGPFKASSDGIKVNMLFSISLTLSLLASSGALLAQQWLVSYSSKQLRSGAVDGYKRMRPGAVDSHRWDRERKYAGAKHWRLEEIIEIALPTLLQAALLVFMIGFVTYLHDLSTPVALPNLILGCIGLACFVACILFALWDPFCPFQSPITGFLRPLVPYKLFRSTKKAEALQVESVARTIENSDNVTLLRTTAANIPLLDASQVESLIWTFPSVVFNLFALYADTDEGAPDHTAYSKALTHLQVIDRSDYADSFYMETFTCSTRLHLDCPGDPFSTIASSIACVAATYLASPQDDDKPEAKRQLQFLAQAIPSASDLGFAVGIVAQMLVARSQKLKKSQAIIPIKRTFSFLPHKEETREWNWAVRLIKKAYHALWTDQDQPRVVLTYVAEAIETYDPRDEAVHELMLGLMSGVVALQQCHRGTGGLAALIGALGLLFANDQGREKDEEVDEEDGRWYEMMDVSLRLMKSIFDRFPTDTHVKFLGFQFSEILSAPGTVTAITQYVETLRRRHDPQHPRSPGSRFPLLSISISRNRFATQQETTEFMAAAAALPTEIFPLAETWARTMKVAGSK